LTSKMPKARPKSRGSVAGRVTWSTDKSSWNSGKPTRDAGRSKTRSKLPGAARAAAGKDTPPAVTVRVSGAGQMPRRWSFWFATIGGVPFGSEQRLSERAGGVDPARQLLIARRGVARRNVAQPRGSHVVNHEFAALNGALHSVGGRDEFGDVAATGIGSDGALAARREVHVGEVE